VLTILAGIMLAIKAPAGSGAPVRIALFAVLIVGALYSTRQDRREGIKAAEPISQHGPPGWEWDPDAATWRPPQ